MTQAGNQQVIRVDLKPANLGVSGWNALLPGRQAQPSLQQDIEADYLIVGAGFAGLSAARRLRQLDKQASVVILEAQQVGQGPAARSSGFMIDLPHALTSGGYAGDAAQDSRDIRMNRAAIAFATDAAVSWSFVDEAFNPLGKINAAASKAGINHNESYARHLHRLNEPCEMLDARAMRDITGSDYYQGGLRTPGTVILQPALYIRSFADALVQQAHCRLFENSAVTGLGREKDRWRLTTEQGSITAHRVILAVNGLIETFGFYRRRLMHVNLYASMTRELSDAEVSLLGGEPCWAFTPSDPLGSTLRRINASGGHRLLIRNRCTYEASLRLPPNRLDTIANDHDRAFRARFPMLNQVSMEYRWSGRLCLSRNNVAAIGKLDQGLYSACCQNGLGISRGTIAGIVTAEMASDRQIDSLIPDYQAEPLPARLFPEPFMTIGARTVLKFKEWKAGKEL